MAPTVIELDRFHLPSPRCPYLPDQRAVMEYRILAGLTHQQYDQLLERGWRRFGMSFFRPACPDCTRCRSLRVDVERFAPSRSQRRSLRRNATVGVRVQAPTLTERHVELYNAYHELMHRRKGWPLQRIDEDEYAATFLSGHWPFAREFLYHQDDRLIGVALADVTSRSLSSVYFFHDPAWRPGGPGVFSILQQIAFAQRHKLSYQYLGYWIAECPSMAYKSAYRPHELLAGSPADDEAPTWVRPESQPGDGSRS